MKIINNLQHGDPLTIIALILAIIVVCGVGFIAIKYGIRPFKTKKYKKNLIQNSVMEDLLRKGIIQNVTKKDKRLAKRGLIRLNRNYKLMKDKNKIEKKITEPNID